MEAIVNAIHREIARSRGRGDIRLGLVTSYDPNAFAVKVTLQPDGTETGWVPVGSPWVGNGWGIFFAPTPGDQVVVDFQEGSHETPIATLRLFDNENRPLPVPSGEMWIVHKSGAYIKLTNDGKIALNAASEIDAGNLSNALMTLVTDAFMSLYNNHEHTNGNDGANTGAPIQQMTSAHLTTVLRAN